MDISAPSRPHDDRGRGWDAGAARSVVLDLSDCIARLTQQNRSSCKLLDAWKPSAKPYLLSAASGGQWPQARLAAIRDGVDDNRCQLCMSAIGTLDHRFECPTTCPPGGWQLPPSECQEFMSALSDDRTRLMRTRGLLAIRVAVPPPASCDTFAWILPLPEDGDQSHWKWFVDGSMLDEPRRFARRTGFGVVVVDSEGFLVAYGCGRPPAWVSTAAGAEAWAFCMVLSITPQPPWVVTDCLEVCKTLASGKKATMSGCKRLALVWRRIFAALDDDAASAVRSLMWIACAQ